MATQVTRLSLFGVPRFYNGSIYSNSITETVTGTDSDTILVTFNDVENESVSATDSIAGGIAYNASFTDTVAGSDSNAITANFVPTMSATATAVDSMGAAVTFPLGITESISTNDGERIVIIKNSAPVFFVAYYHPIVETSLSLVAYYNQPEAGLFLVAYFKGV